MLPAFLAEEAAVMRKAVRPRISVITILWAATVSIIVLSPIAVGVFPVSSVYSIVALLALVFTLYAFWSRRDFSFARRIALVIISVSFALTCSDLFARLLPVSVLYRTPEEAFKKRWAPMPLLARYATNVTYEAMTYGDLAAMSGNKQAREYRDVRFVTDGFGFRNDKGAGQKDRGPQLIMLGDSFGEGLGNSQENTWSSILAKDYGLNVYNLSIEGTGPWQEFTDLSVEVDRLRPAAGSTVVWAIFPGNDLDDTYFAELEKSRLPWNGRFGRLGQSIRSFRFQSPVSQIFQRTFQPAPANQVLNEKFLDGKQMLFFAPYAKNKERTLDQVLQHPHYANLKATINAMGQLAAAKRLQVVIVLVPSKEEVYSWVLDHTQPWSANSGPSGFATALKDISQQDGISLLDLKPAMIEESKRVFEQSGELLWWRDDTHWNTAGHKFAASVVYNEIILQPGDVKSARSFVRR